MTNYNTNQVWLICKGEPYILQFYSSHKEIALFGSKGTVFTEYYRTKTEGDKNWNEINDYIRSRKEIRVCE